MTIWIDGDACPRHAKEIIFRAAERVEVDAILVANRDLRVPRSRFARSVKVAKGFDFADHHILGAADPGDIVITADIPLAAALVAKGVHVISDRGEIFDEGNVGDRLATRDLLASLRDQGAVTRGPAPYGNTDRRNLASALDRLLTRLMKGRG